MSAFDKILNINEMFGNQLAGDDLSVPASVYKSIPTYGDFREAQKEVARLRAIEKAAELMADYMKAILETVVTGDWEGEKRAIAEYEKAVGK